MKKIIRVLRFDPEIDTESHFEDYEVDLDGGTSVLLAYHDLRQNDDPSLTIRSSCRAAVCGSCAVMINGRPRLACKSLLQDFKSDVITLEPLPTYPVIKDLVVDIEQFFEDYKKLEPWLQTNQKPENGKEFIQTQEQREKLDPYASCISCGICQGGCPSREKASSEYMGPALIVKTHRWIADSRDDEKEKRLKNINVPEGQGGCNQFSECTKLCPLDIPGDMAVLHIRKNLVLGIMNAKKYFKNK